VIHLAVLGVVGGAFVVLCLPATRGADTRLFLAVNRRHAGPRAEVGLRLVSHLGLLPTNVLLWLWAMAGPLGRSGAVGAVGMVAAWGSCRIVKAATHRGRPHASVDGARLVGLVPSGSSFPSSHAALAFYSAAFLSIALNASVGAQIALYGLAAVVAYVRVYLGAHYPRDVLAGATVGVATALVTAWIAHLMGIPVVR
jgi:undecaprenyl-diphosphatase